VGCRNTGLGQLTEALVLDAAYTFDFANGKQDGSLFEFPNNTLDVRTGDVGAVPVPAALWLFGSGLVGLVSLGVKNMKLL